MKQSLWTVKLLLWLPRVAAGSSTSFQGPSTFLILNLLLLVHTWGWRQHPSPCRDEVRQDVVQKGAQPTSEEQHQAPGCGFIHYEVVPTLQRTARTQQPPHTAPLTPSQQEQGDEGEGSCCTQTARCRRTNPSHSPLPQPLFFFSFLNE